MHKCQNMMKKKFSKIIPFLESSDPAVKIQMQMEFSRHFFYSNICHVCHRHDNEFPLKKCGNCKMIFYCSREHQKQHWPSHKSFCQNISNLKHTSDNSDSYDGQEDRSIKGHIQSKANLIHLMETLMKRKLEPYENEIIEYSKTCEVCLEGDPSLLKSCAGCPQANFCKDHENDPVAHENFCALYMSCYKLDYYAIIFQECPTPRMMEFTPDNSKIIRFPNSMQEYLDIFYKPRTDTNIPDEDVKMYVSQHFTRPLTLIYAMEKIDFKPQSELIIHIIGANRREEKSMLEWEILFHWLPQLLKLKVVLVGPELSNNDHLKNGNQWNLCNKCASQGKTIEVEIHSTLYKTYCEEKYFVEPDMILGFNLGIIAYRSWKNSILAIAKLACPFVLTAFSEREAEDDHKIMQWEFETDAKIEKNRFPSLRPKRSPLGDKVFYENQFVTVYNDLGQNNMDEVEKEERKL